MKPEELKERIPEEELVFSASRSSGPGGQNVNKVNTKIELRFNIQKSSCLDENEKLMIYKRLSKRINKEGEIVVKSQSERTQARNREKAFEKMLKMISMALTEKIERKATSPTQKSQLKRLDQKRKRGLIKKLRIDKDHLTPE